jgi:hypothetical protein
MTTESTRKVEHYGICYSPNTDKWRVLKDSNYCMAVCDTQEEAQDVADQLNEKDGDTSGSNYEN